MYRSRVFAEQTASSAAGGTRILRENKARVGLVITVSGEDARITDDGSSPSATHGLPVADGGNYSMERAGAVPTGEIRAWSSGGTAKINGHERIPIV